MVLYIFFLVLVAHLPMGSADQRSRCKVTAYTQAGPVCGLVLKDRLAVFRGMPYGQQPVGKYRFQKLRPLKPWKGVLDATKEGPVCPQVDNFWMALQNLTNINEACIYANIHTPLAALPKIRSNKKGCKKNKNKEKKPGLPVLVFVPGGSWQTGSGNSDFYGPEYFVDRDVVLITMNYRLNVFGFMSLNTTEVPGNQGLLDIIHLLRWVRDNVRAFGGDPDNVTLMGESVGSVSVHYVAQSSLSKGLIKKAILSSGAALPTFFTIDPAYARYISGLMLNTLGINSLDPHAAFQILKKMPIDKILEAIKVVQDTSGGFIQFAPVQESKSLDAPIIVGKEEDILKGGANDVPMLIGFNSNECVAFQNRIRKLKLIEAVNENSTLLLPPKLLYTLSADKLEKLADVLKQRYFMDDIITYENYIPLCNDLFFRYPITKLAQIRAKTSAFDTYLYQFNYAGEYRTVVKGLNLEPFEGMAHVEDLTYIFRSNNILNKYPPPPTPVDDSMRASWIDTIINFMKCSRPVCGWNSTNWPPVSSKRVSYQEIRGPRDYVSSPITKEQKDMINFFDDLLTSQ